MQKYLKKFRLVWALLFLAITTFLFLDFTEKLPEGMYRALLGLQLVPSLLQLSQILAHGAALSVWGLLTVLMLTLLFGRVYCSFICPLGILQDITGFFGKKIRGKKGRLRFAPPQNILRYSLLGVVVVSLFFGGTLLLNLTDPYSNFGRIASDLMRPLYLHGNNILASILNGMGSYLLYPFDIVRVQPLTLMVPILVLILVVWLSVTRSRLYCNTLCPVGALLGLISKISLFRPTFEKSKCNRCGDCMYACKSQCIDIKTQTVDISRCVGCFNCVSVCTKDAMKYKIWGSGFQVPASPGSGFAEFQVPGSKVKVPSSKVKVQGSQSSKPETRKAPKAQETRNQKPEKPELGTRNFDVSKRKFFLESTVFLASVAGSISLLKAQETADSSALDIAFGFDGLLTDDQIADFRRVPVCPPGSVGLDHFTSTCTACHLCVSACPTGVLQPTFLGYGLLGINMPRMDYVASFCNQHCIKCGEVCPNGAILPLAPEQKATVQLGQVYFNESHCIVVKDETSCGSCAEHCPTKAVRMVPYKGELTIPFTDTSICIGCGACQYACPVEEKAIFVLSNKVHLVAETPVEEEVEQTKMEEFPF